MLMFTMRRAFHNTELTAALQVLLKQWSDNNNTIPAASAGAKPSEAADAHGAATWHLPLAP